MATGDSIICSDGLIGIKIGAWAKDKLFHIERYCDIFSTGMSYKWPIRTYIDIFAGPGVGVIDKSSKEVDGSPLVALNSTRAFTHYFLNDSNSNFIEALKNRVKSRYSKTNVNYFNEDCNSLIDKLCTELPTNSLDFCFIDPLNWEITFESIRKLTQSRKMDLAITFHIGAIKRAADNPPRELMNFFPTPDWYSKYLDTRGQHTTRVLLDSYISGLKDIGYVAIRDYVLEKNIKNVKLYHLIFASKHQKGAEFWDKIAGRQETGQMRIPDFM